MLHHSYYWLKTAILLLGLPVLLSSQSQAASCKIFTGEGQGATLINALDAARADRNRKAIRAYGFKRVCRPRYRDCRISRFVNKSHNCSPRINQGRTYYYCKVKGMICAIEQGRPRHTGDEPFSHDRPFRPLNR